MSVPIETPLAKNWTELIVAPGVDAAAVAETVTGVPEVAEEPPTGLVRPTEGAALMVTVTLVETPRLPKLSVTSALRV